MPLGALILPPYTLRYFNHVRHRHRFAGQLPAGGCREREREKNRFIALRALVDKIELAQTGPPGTLRLLLKHTI